MGICSHTALLFLQKDSETKTRSQSDNHYRHAPFQQSIFSLCSPALSVGPILVLGSYFRNKSYLHNANCTNMKKTNINAAYETLISWDAQLDRCLVAHDVPWWAPEEPVFTGVQQLTSCRSSFLASLSSIPSWEFFFGIPSSYVGHLNNLDIHGRSCCPQGGIA